MQHLDEGTIHSWLDGALPPDEAARVEAHVSECAQCAAMAAEARGFIAASSRILTALDDAPRGVIPIQPIVRRRFGPAWRAAAAVLVVALGTVAIRNTLRVNRSGEASLALDSVVTTSSKQTPAVESVGNAAAPAAADRAVRPMVLSKPASPSRAASTRPSSAPPAPALSPSIAQVQKASAPTARPLTKSAEAPATLGAVAMRETAQDEASNEQPLKIVRVDSTSAEKRTVYEIAPSETVTLVESRVADRTELGNVVVTGAATGAAGASVPSASDSRRAMSPNTVRSNAAAPHAQATAAFAAAERTIEWKDRSTGHVLRLTGRYPPERLEEIKKRIERQRAAQKKP